MWIGILVYCVAAVAFYAYLLGTACSEVKN